MNRMSPRSYLRRNFSITMRRTVILLVVISGSAQVATLRADWPAFRGPQGDGVARDATPPLRWGPDENIRWKAPLPRPGNGSPIVVGEQVFVACAENEKGTQRSLYCFDRRNGERLWVRTVDFGVEMPTHEMNPYCGSTPASDGQRVVVWHGSAGLFCYDMEGNELWARSLGEYRHMWGYGTSPILYKGKVIMHCGPGRRIAMAALDLATGRTLWETEEPHKGTGEEREDGNYMGSWTTPVIAEVNGQDHIICAMPTRLVAYDPESGEILWTCDGLRHDRGDLAYSSPIIADDLCFVTAGFQGPMMAVRLGGQGDITSDRLWRTERQPQNIGSGVYVDGYVYRPNAGPGTIQCIDPRTGQIRWTQRATGEGGFWSSMIYAGGHCYVTDQDGTTIVLRPNPSECEIVARNALEEPTNATPAFSGKEIFIRTANHVYCIAE